MPDVTQILSRIESGDPSMRTNYFHWSMRSCKAATKLAQEKPGQTLQARREFGRQTAEPGW